MDEESKLKEDFLEENQTALSTATTVATITIALLILMTTYLSTEKVPFSSIVINLVTSSLIIATISFITASTYFIRGSNPEFNSESIKYYNRKGDLFLALGWWALFLLPIMLIAALKLFISAMVSTLFLLIAMRNLLKDRIATYAFKLPIYTIRYRSFSKASKRARTEGWTNVDEWISRVFYIISISIIIILFLHILRTSN